MSWPRSGADTVVADTELAPSQRRALEDAVKVKVIDRTAVILDIFSQHAKSREGKAQVELAQLEYLLPRLRGWGESMSRQAGGQVGGAGSGMGSRGPGETKIELDRRRIHTRMARLRKQIKGFAPARRGQARQPRPLRGAERRDRGLHQRRQVESAQPHHAAPACSSRTRCSRPSTRRCAAASTPDGRVFTLADTVGFVRNLPHQLVEAFRSTLEEVGNSDVIVHVVDGAHPDPGAQLATVRDVIGEVGARDLPEIVVFNKSDLASTTTGGSCCAASSPARVRRRPAPARASTSCSSGSPSCCPQPNVELDLAGPVRPRRPGVVRCTTRARAARRRLRGGRHADAAAGRRARSPSG